MYQRDKASRTLPFINRLSLNFTGRSPIHKYVNMIEKKLKLSSLFFQTEWIVEIIKGESIFSLIIKKLSHQE